MFINDKFLFRKRDGLTLFGRKHSSDLKVILVELLCYGCLESTKVKS